MKLNDVLRDLVGASGKSQNEVAADLGVSASMLSQWLSGKESCGLSYLSSIALKLGPSDPQARCRLLARLFSLLDADRIEKPGADKWTAETKNLAAAAVDLMQTKLEFSNEPAAAPRVRTLEHFPDAFYPLVVVTGDKREESESRINMGDFGAVAASPAEARWIFQLGLRKDVEFFGDKVVVMENIEQLRKRFGKTNILVVGSPGSNHLARRCLMRKPLPGWRAAVPIISFNIHQHVLEQIEKYLDSLSGRNAAQLVGEQGNPQTKKQLKHWLHCLFGGGIIDPTNHDWWKRADDVRPALDFGLISLGRNPFAESDKYVCIFAAGIHMLGTAHAIRMLANPKNFADHPFGGVLRVDVDVQDQFAKRFDTSRSNWDSESAYSIAELLAELKRKSPPHVEFAKEHLDELYDFVEKLAKGAV